MGPSTTLFQHEAKGQPVPKDETVNVEAFGARKCPKLIEQVCSENPVTRRNALAVLCDEMRNPVSVQGCVEAGMVGVLNNYISKSEDPETKARASRALALAAGDANGRRSMLEENSAGEVLPGIDDGDINVRSNVYEALVTLCKGTVPCLKAVIGAHYPSVLVSKAAAETPEVQPLVLQLMYQCLKDQSGLDDVLGSGGVKTCISLLESGATPVRKEAAATLGFLCFTEKAKHDAIKSGAVPLLCALLLDKSVEVKSAAASALMAITTTDEGKLALVPAKGGDALVEVFADTDPVRERGLLLNVLKCISNAVVHPEVRASPRSLTRV